VDRERSPAVFAPARLAHGLPAGLRDLLPVEAERRRALAGRVIEHVGLHGYRLVTLPAFELAEVLERGLGALDPRDVLRFVEPESGEVAALRPDMTPQIARMVATRLSQEPRPLRLAYEGTIVRRRHGRARRDRQVPQAGIELFGLSGPESDVEVIALAASVTRALGLTDVVIDLGHARIVRSLIERLPEGIAIEVADALSQKDAARVEDLLRHVENVPSSLARTLVELAGLEATVDGFDALFTRASRLLEGTPAEGPLRELASVVAVARSVPDLSALLRIDLGAMRGFAYYTGAIFELLATGPGEPIGGGGRYDELLARFDAPMPAIGFGLNLDAVASARSAASIVDAPRRRVLVAGDSKAHRALVDALRARGIPAITHDAASAEAYAQAWGFTEVVQLDPSIDVTRLAERIAAGNSAGS
jgi:ATP phosphoribosyltransferase regulatory subunit